MEIQGQDMWMRPMKILDTSRAIQADSTGVLQFRMGATSKVMRPHVKSIRKLVHHDLSKKRGGGRKTSRENTDLCTRPYVIIFLRLKEQSPNQP